MKTARRALPSLPRRLPTPIRRPDGRQQHGPVGRRVHPHAARPCARWRGPDMATMFSPIQRLRRRCSGARESLIAVPSLDAWLRKSRRSMSPVCSLAATASRRLALSRRSPWRARIRLTMPDDLPFGAVEIAAVRRGLGGLPGRDGAAADDDTASEQRCTHGGIPRCLPLSAGPWCCSRPASEPEPAAGRGPSRRRTIARCSAPRSAIPLESKQSAPDIGWRREPSSGHRPARPSGPARRPAACARCATGCG